MSSKIDITLLTDTKILIVFAYKLIICDNNFEIIYEKKNAIIILR